MKPTISTPEPRLDATFDHVFNYWPTLTRSGDSLAFPLQGRFVKPGGFFKWFFYWDSYFALLGLVVQGKWQLAREIVEGFVAEIEAFDWPDPTAPGLIADDARTKAKAIYEAQRYMTALEVSPLFHQYHYLRGFEQWIAGCPPTAEAIRAGLARNPTRQ